MQSLNQLDKLWSCKIRSSSDVSRSLWRELNRYAGDDAARRAFATYGSDSRLLGKFKRCIALADSYFLAYDDASEAIDPVLLYYGSMWLGLAVCYLMHGPDTMEKRSKSHGIHFELDTKRSMPIVNANLMVGEPAETFGLINSAFGGKVAKGDTCKVLDLLKAIPNLDDALQSTVSVGTQALQVLPPENNGCISPELISGTVIPPEHCNEGYFKARIIAYEYLKSANVEFGQHGQIMWKPTVRDVSLELSAITTNGYLIPVVGRLRITEFCHYLGIVYALSAMCRYYPDQWLDTLDRSGDEYYLIREFIHLAEEQIITLALNHMSTQLHVMSAK